MKGNLIRNFVIGTFVALYTLTSIVSTIHVIDFFELSNPRWMAITLAIGFEIGAAASLASLIVLGKMNKTIIWALFISITAMQMMGNMYYSFTNLSDFSNWSELFNLIEEDVMYQKRIISFISGGLLPLIALGFIKSLVDYIKPDVEKAANAHMEFPEELHKEQPKKEPVKRKQEQTKTSIKQERIKRVEPIIKPVVTVMPEHLITPPMPIPPDEPLVKDVTTDHMIDGNPQITKTPKPTKVQPSNISSYVDSDKDINR